MSDENHKPFRLEITQDKLVDLLMHAATREDIAKLDSKIDQNIANLDGKIDHNTANLEAKLDKLEEKAATKADLANLASRFTRLELKVDTMIWGIIIAILVPIALHFIK